MEDLIAIARIVKPRGLRGETAADLLTDFPERFGAVKRVTARFSGGETRGLEIENFWFQKDRVILKFAGIDKIEQAEELRDAEICIPESDAVELDEGEFYDWQLEGCSVETVEGEKIGTVKELLRTGGTEILVVAGAGKDFMIPFAEAICVVVDIENKLIKVDPPEGLLEF